MSASYSVPLTEDAWRAFDRDGFIVVDGLADAKTLRALNERLDALMDGTVRHGDALLMQLDPSSPEASAGAPAAASAGRGASSELDAYSAGGAAALFRFSVGVAVAGQSVGWKGRSRAYRKVGEAQAGLEVDPVFSAWMRGAALRAIAERVYGPHAPVAVYRAMAMCKPAGDAGGGTALPWHQDGGAWWALDRDPLVFVWLALTRATAANGAVKHISPLILTVCALWEPVLGSLLGYVLGLQGAPSPLTALAATALLAGGLLVSWPPSSKQAT